MADYGMKMSVAGEPVKAATGEDVQFTSARNNLKTAEPVVITITITGGVGTATIAHGQSFRPFAFVFVHGASGGEFYLPSYVTGGLSSYYVDSTNLVITINSPFSADGTQFTVTYYLSETESAA